MKKRQLVMASVIMGLFVSNIATGQSYIIEKNQLEREITYKNKIIKNNHINYKYDLESQQDTIDDLVKSLNEKSEEIYRLQQELEKAANDSESPSVELMEITAYTAGYESTQKQKGDKGYGITASGTYVEEGRTIACPPSIEFGTKLNIEGIGLRICEDRGGAIKEGHLDLYMDSVSAALAFGRRTLSVEILNQEG